MCGEHPSSGTRHNFKSGSSPRVRGTRCLVHGLQHLYGIIPACAGNTRSESSERWPPGDHPRVCGEHFFGTPNRACALGSSPRVRGTLGGFLSSVIGTGIIPACAGNTRTPLPSSNVLRDHPRVCGEHIDVIEYAGGYKGSSPRVRGTLLKIPVQNTIATELRLLFNKFAKQLKRCFTIRFGTMRILVVKVQQIKQGLQAIVGRIWHLFPRRYDR